MTKRNWDRERIRQRMARQGSEHVRTGESMEVTNDAGPGADRLPASRSRLTSRQQPQHDYPWWYPRIARLFASHNGTDQLTVVRVVEDLLGSCSPSGRRSEESIERIADQLTSLLTPYQRKRLRDLL